MADKLTYEIVVGSPAAVDVVSRELTVVVDGVYNDPVAYAADTLSFGQVTVPQDSEVIVSVVDVDDAGNRSEPATLVFTALDVVPPPAPGGVSVVLVGENLEPEAPVAPVEPEVVVEPEVDVPADEPATDEDVANG